MLEPLTHKIYVQVLNWWIGLNTSKEKAPEKMKN